MLQIVDNEYLGAVAYVASLALLRRSPGMYTQDSALVMVCALVRSVARANVETLETACGKGKIEAATCDAIYVEAERHRQRAAHGFAMEEARVGARGVTELVKNVRWNGHDEAPVQSVIGSGLRSLDLLAKLALEHLLDVTA